MGRYISDYIKYVNKILADDSTDTDYENLMDDFLKKISFFQHERLIHLIVTVMVAILLFISIIYIFMTQMQIMAVLSLILLVLVFCYLGYYYFIENTVMEMYKTYDKIAERIERSKQSEMREKN